MPQAVVSLDTERHDLKTLEGGFVELRKLSYGEILKRRDMMQTMRQVPAESNGNTDMQLDFHFSRIRGYEFSKAIVEHNLEDEKGKKLNLASESNLARLDPKVGQEIEQVIEKMNQFDAEADKGATFRGPSDPSDSPRAEGAPKSS